MKLLCVVIVVITLIQCGDQSPLTQYPLKVLVSIPPQEFFVEKIGGEYVSVEALAGFIVSHEHSLSLKKLSSVSDSALYIHLGVEGFPFEAKTMQQLSTLSNHSIHNIALFPKTSTLIDKDPHLWLSPLRVIDALENIYTALVKIDPNHQKEYHTHYTQLIQQTTTLHKALKVTLASVRGKAFLSYHPAWRYFAQDYDLHEIPLEEHQSPPSLKRMQALIRQARTQGIRTIVIPHALFQAQVQHMAQELNAKVLVLNPLAKDWDTNLKHAASTLQEALS